jgi:hypothetical protein
MLPLRRQPKCLNAFPILWIDNLRDSRSTQSPSSCIAGQAHLFVQGMWSFIPPLLCGLFKK